MKTTGGGISAATCRRRKAPAPKAAPSMSEDRGAVRVVCEIGHHKSSGLAFAVPWALAILPHPSGPIIASPPMPSGWLTAGRQPAGASFGLARRIFVDPGVAARLRQMVHRRCALQGGRRNAMARACGLRSALKRTHHGVLGPTLSGRGADYPRARTAYSRTQADQLWRSPSMPSGGRLPGR